MNGRKAKALRKKIYGDQSFKSKEYGFFTTVKRLFTRKTDDSGEKVYENVNKTTIVCKGLRHLYQTTKRGTTV